MNPPTTHASANLPATRAEIVERVGHAFGDRPLTRSEVLDAATGSRDQVMDVLCRLPDRRYSLANDLWVELPEVPVER